MRLGHTHLLPLVLSVALVFLSAGVSRAASHEELVKGPFKTGPEVTRACLACHEKEARDFMKTVHWTWSKKQKVKGGAAQELGKKNAINNFCIALGSNWPRCTSCHAGYGWKDASFDFNDPTLVDCLVCHDTTGTYKKVPTGAGVPDPKVDLLKVAGNVGAPSRAACGSCHFYGGGGDHIKHGDLDSSMANPSRDYDVHMGSDGGKMNCQACHKTKNHAIAGEALAVSMGSGMRVDCTDCHTAKPHRNPVYNRHTRRIACQTCHIPTFAKSLPTKVWWDWSKAGKDITPVPKDQYGLETYSKMKGEFVWQKDIVPTYAWYNGKTERYLLGDKIDPTRVVHLNSPLGSRGDKTARITPFKVMRGKQAYDSKNNYLAVVHLFGGYWKHYDLKKAIADGMAAEKLPFSGEYGFVETDMYWKVNHMVVPKEKALRCDSCHGARSRLDWKALGYTGDPKGKK